MSVRYIYLPGYLNAPRIRKGRTTRSWPYYFLSVEVTGDFSPVTLLESGRYRHLGYRADTPMEIVFQSDDDIYRHSIQAGEIFHCNLGLSMRKSALALEVVS